MRLETNGLSSVIACPAVLRPAPGQYLAASSPESSEAFPTILFPSRIGSQEIGIAAPIPAHWKVGMQLDLRGPLGKGFHMPLTARRIALSCPEAAPDRLLPLAYQALAQNAAVAIYAQGRPCGSAPRGRNPAPRPAPRSLSVGRLPGSGYIPALPAAAAELAGPGAVPAPGLPNPGTAEHAHAVLRAGGMRRVRRSHPR